jgi:hypothetical protein
VLPNSDATPNWLFCYPIFIDWVPSVDIMDGPAELYDVTFITGFCCDGAIAANLFIFAAVSSSLINSFFIFAFTSSSLL